jgi:hypothetical protein
MIRLLTAAGCLAALALCSAASARLEGAGKAEKQLGEYLAEHKITGGQVVSLAAPPLAKNFPDYEFFAVRFRIYPVARKLPEGMKPSNIFAVSKDGKVRHLKDEKALEGFFRADGPAAKTNEDASSVVQAWLSLSPDFIQDGFYKFEVSKEVGITRDDVEPKRLLSAQGRVIVVCGGKGDINATLKFAKDGKIDSVSDDRKVRPGPRPICQATKLLDPDPIVRRMAEADLLFMGTDARDYLMEQRAKASPALRQAIDRLWQRILQERW